MEQTTIAKPAAGAAADDWPEERSRGALGILWHHRELVQALTLRDIRSRYKQSVLGIAWALLQPLALTAVFTVVMSYIARVDTGGVPYPVFAYIAMLPWTFFAGALTAGTECLVANFNLITKIYFPREVFPISSVMGKTVDLGLGVLVLIPLFVIYSIKVTPWILFVLPVLAVQVAFVLGLSFLLSSANLFYRDIRHVMPLLTQLWMYLTPVIYSLDMVPKKYLGLYMLNPMVAVIESYRRVALMGDPPMWGYLGVSAVISLVTLVVGYGVFKRLEPLFAEMI